ncbi:MAG TPA: hypothetical protein PKE57_04470 [Cellvibrionaceae bacterium]|nr:hypothetical protein [Cellvibrionaceae bacterium]HMW71624.1 hypothetical protein [Cellvibrionaceae bacterium]HNG60836.1 hypothetical protein [Cellvibrionaceae bacterium]
MNRDCFCVTLNQQQLRAQLLSDQLSQDLLLTHPHLFAQTSVFLSPDHFQQIQRVIAAIGRVVKRPEFTQQVLHLPADNSCFTAQPLGVFMGYDFHLGAAGPKLIEINTNAGGAFLNALLVDAQSACCRSTHVEALTKESLHQQFYAMFQNEWQLMRGDKPLKTMAIIDVQPEQQYLYPEFKMAQHLFARHGITALIADPSELCIQGNALCVLQTGQLHEIDLVYNRLTDFALKEHTHLALRQAFEADLAVITPNPNLHARYADKRNLCVLSDECRLRALGVSEGDIAVLKEAIPATRLVKPEDADELWAARKQLFFKPWAGFGGRAAYRGDKLSLRIWQEIVHGHYIAQQVIPPSERGILVDGNETTLKMDIRAYVYDGAIQLLAARLYQGQTTNFRTPGGGFAPVYIMSR